MKIARMLTKSRTMNDDIYAKIAKRVSDYKKTSVNTNTEELEDLTVSLASVFSVSRSEVKLIINDLMATNVQTISAKDVLLDKAIKHSKDVFMMVLLFLIASYILL